MGPSITGSVAAGIGTHTSPRRTGVRRGDKWRGFAELNGGFRATSEGICAGHGVVPVGEGIASGLDPARKPRESPPNKSALYGERDFSGEAGREHRVDPAWSVQLGRPQPHVRGSRGERLN